MYQPLVSISRFEFRTRHGEHSRQKVRAHSEPHKEDVDETSINALLQRNWSCTSSLNAPSLEPVEPNISSTEALRFSLTDIHRCIPRKRDVLLRLVHIQSQFIRGKVCMILVHHNMWAEATQNSRLIESGMLLTLVFVNFVRPDRKSGPEPGLTIPPDSGILGLGGKV
jgi:hypothetical protein